MQGTLLNKNEDIVSRRIESEVILVPIRQKTSDLQCIYTTNEVGSMVWDLIDGKHSIQDIVETIASEFNVSPEQAKVDIEDFIDQLIAAGCVQEI